MNVVGSVMIRDLRVTALLWGAVTACAASEKPVLQPVSDQALSSLESDSKAPRPFTARPDLAEVFGAAGLQGSIAVFDETENKLYCSEAGGCDRELGPASTFKIAHALIGLELGKLDSAEHVFPWDGREYTVPSWNQDHTLRSAMEVSCVPCFQSLARSIGREEMSRMLVLLGYGNENPGGPIDSFWLEPGALRVTQRQQLSFLRKLAHGELPVRKGAADVAIDVIPSTSGDGWTLRGKTGGLMGEEPVGWYVGWLESGEQKIYFATVLQPFDIQRSEMRAARREVTVDALRRLTGIAVLE